MRVIGEILYLSFEDSQGLVTAQRRERGDGRIIWSDGSTVWKQENGSGWKVLVEDESVKPKSHIRGEGSVDILEYPEEKTGWVDCEAPAYEKMYIEQKTQQEH